MSGAVGGPDPAPASLAISNGGSGALDWSVSDDAPWLSVSPASGSGPASLQVSGSLAGLAAGTHTATITVTAPGVAGSPKTVPVTLTVATAPDTTAPTVSLSAPAAGATLSGTVAVSAGAADAVGVTGVQFRLDGAPLGAEDTSAPYSVSWNTTGAANGAHTLTAVARDAAGNSATSAAVDVSVQNGGSPETVGRWSEVQDWPIVAVHMILMPTGQVLAFDGWGNAPNSHRLWNPSNGTFIGVPYGLNIFCGGQTTLGDGRAIIVGGHVAAYVGTKDTTIFDAQSQTWSAKADMFRSRWYPTATALPDGRVLAISGDNPTQGKPINRLYDTSSTIPEVYNPATDTWTQLTGAAREVRLYPFMFVLPDGRVIDAGPFTQTQYLNLTTGTWTAGPTSQIDGHSAVQYRPGKIMKSGTAADPDFPDLNVTGRTVVLDTTAALPGLARGGVDGLSALLPGPDPASRRQRARHRRRDPLGRRVPAVRRQGGRALEPGDGDLEHDGLASSGRACTTPPPCCCPTAGCWWPEAAPSPAPRRSTRPTPRSTRRPTSSRGRGPRSPRRPRRPRTAARSPSRRPTRRASAASR